MASARIWRRGGCGGGFLLTNVCLFFLRAPTIFLFRNGGRLNRQLFSNRIIVYISHLRSIREFLLFALIFAVSVPKS